MITGKPYIRKSEKSISAVQTLLTEISISSMYSVKNPFENTTNPREFGLETTTNFYIDGPMGKLGAW